MWTLLLCVELLIYKWINVGNHKIYAENNLLFPLLNLLDTPMQNKWRSYTFLFFFFFFSSLWNYIFHAHTHADNNIIPKSFEQPFSLPSRHKPIKNIQKTINKLEIREKKAMKNTKKNYARFVHYKFVSRHSALSWWCCCCCCRRCYFFFPVLWDLFFFLLSDERV